VSRCVLVRCITPFILQTIFTSVTRIIEGYGPVGADGKRELKLRDTKTKVTLRHLLTHSAGLAYYWNHDHMVEYYKPSEGEAHAILPFASGDISDFASPAVREAGEQMEYSPVTDWLGQFAIRSTGKNLRQLFQDLITTPLGISTSEFDILISKMGQADISGVHVRGPGGDQGPDFINIPFGIYQPEDDEPPAGKAHFASACVYASPRAYGKFLQAVSGISEEVSVMHCTDTIDDAMSYQVPRS
jgi:methyl acetate hydrolase